MSRQKGVTRQVTRPGIDEIGEPFYHVSSWHTIRRRKSQVIQPAVDCVWHARVWPQHPIPRPQKGEHD
jgi:hypothetical protein